MGCKLSSDDLVEVDESKQTPIAGLYAVGDASSPFSQIALAVTSGTLAAAFINRALIEENLVELDTLGECNNSNNLHTTLVIQSTT